MVVKMCYIYICGKPKTEHRYWSVPKYSIPMAKPKRKPKRYSQLWIKWKDAIRKQMLSTKTPLDAKQGVPCFTIPTRSWQPTSTSTRKYQYPKQNEDQPKLREHMHLEKISTGQHTGTRSNHNKGLYFNLSSHLKFSNGTELNNNL